MKKVKWLNVTHAHWNHQKDFMSATLVYFVTQSHEYAFFAMKNATQRDLYLVKAMECKQWPRSIIKHVMIYSTTFYFAIYMDSFFLNK